MITVIALFLVGIFLSAFFSGNETGFYRVTRLRLVMDGLQGDIVAKRLLWLTNNPSLFVATTLVGNNVANYLVSLSIVMGSQRLMGEASLAVDIIAPIALTPILFIYGESLPKNLFLKMPNYLLRKSGLAFLFFFSLLIPVSVLLWLIGRLLEKLIGQSPVKVRLTLARTELDEILQEGHDEGILQKSQRDLANAMFSFVDRPVREFVKPVSRFQTFQNKPSVEDLIKFGRENKVGMVVYSDEHNQLKYVKLIELLVKSDDQVVPAGKVIDVNETELHGIMLVRMQTEKKPIARVLDSNGKAVGFITVNDLNSKLLEKT